MKRINFHIPEKLLATLKKRQQQTGLTVAEQIRQAVKEYLRQSRPARK